jgi:hypothetical protein
MTLVASLFASAQTKQYPKWILRGYLVLKKYHRACSKMIMQQYDLQEIRP